MVSALKSNICRKPLCLQRVDDQDIALRIKHAARRRLRMSALPNNEKIGALAEEPNERFPQQTVLNQEKRADRKAGDRFVLEIHYFLLHLRLDEEGSLTQRIKDLAVNWRCQNRLDASLLSSRISFTFQ